MNIRLGLGPMVKYETRRIKTSLIFDKFTYLLTCDVSHLLDRQVNFPMVSIIASNVSDLVGVSRGVIWEDRESW